jgi:malonyl-CoA O-methyltransferase
MPKLDCVRGARALDVGCGTGRWLKHFQGLGAASLIGIDRSQEMLAIARTRGLSNTELYQSDAAHLPPAAESVDVVIASFLVSYLNFLWLFLQEISRVLRPGGILFVTDLHPESRQSGWNSTFRHESKVYVIDIVPYSLDDLLRQASLAGFRTQFCLEPSFEESERQFFLKAQRDDLFQTSLGQPAIYIAAMRKGHDGLRRYNSHAG